MKKRLEELLVRPDLPWENDPNCIRTEATGFPSDIQAELSRKLAHSAGMVVDPSIASPLYEHKAEQEAKLGKIIR